MTRLDEIDLRILGAAYEWWYGRHDVVPHLELIASVARAMSAEGGFAGIPDLDERLERLQHLNLLVDDGHCYLILPYGAAAVERKGTAPRELVARIQQMRVALLERLTQLYRTRGRYASSHYSTLATELGFESKMAMAVLFQLERAGLVDENGHSGTYRVSQEGLSQADEVAAVATRVSEFHQLANLEPHPRGRALQKYLAALFAEQGWDALEGATTDHEEMDVVLSRSREFYLLECKWEKKPARARYVRELRGKLDNRADVRGILVSMSGFASTAIQQIRDYANSRVILAFGPGDIEATVTGAADFGDLLEVKYRDLVILKSVVVDGLPMP